MLVLVECNLLLLFSFQFYTHANSDHLDLISKDWLSCNICNIFLPTSAAIKNHKSSSHSAKNSTTDRVQCRYCHNSYLTAFQYYKHANKAHLVSDTVIKWIPEIWIDTKNLVFSNSKSSHFGFYDMNIQWGSEIRPSEIRKHLKSKIFEVVYTSVKITPILQR